MKVKIRLQRARLEEIEPMEVVQKYTNGFHDVMRLFNITPPSIEPTATGHIVEQIEFIKQVIDNGYAYEVEALSISMLRNTTRTILMESYREEM